MAPNPERASSLMQRPLVRLALAAVVLALLGGVAFAVTAARGGDSATPAPGADGTQSANDGTPTGPLGSGPPLIGQPAPDFALRDRDGNIVKLSDLRGKVVWVNFWATWCEPCKKELPAIQKLYDEKRADGLEVLEVNYQEGHGEAEGFFDDRSLTLPLLFDDGGVYEQYRLQGLPDSFFVDRNGNLAALQFGYLTEDKMRERLATAGLP